MSVKRFAIFPGAVRSANDGEEHFVGYSELIRLWGVDPKLCFDGRVASRWAGRDVRSITCLRPRIDGGYEQMKKRWEGRLQLCEPWPEADKEVELDELVREYHERVDAFDERVCTGPVARWGERLPKDGDEARAVRENALAVRRGLYLQARALGIDMNAWVEAIVRGRRLRPPARGGARV